LCSDAIIPTRQREPKALEVLWQGDAAAAEPIAIVLGLHRGHTHGHGRPVGRAGTRARTNGQVRPGVEQDDLDVATNEVHAGVRVYGEALGRRLPGPGVGARRTWRDGDTEADRGVGEVVVCPVRAKHLGAAAVGPEELGRLRGVVAGELEALAEAAGLGAERVEELGVAAAGGAVSKGIS